MAVRDPKEFAMDDSFQAVDGWEIGTYPSEKEDGFLSIPMVAARHKESGHVYALDISISKEAGWIGTLFGPKIITGIEGNEEKEEAERQMREGFEQAPVELRNALIDKTKKIEQEHETQGMADEVAHYLLERMGVEQRYSNRHEYRHASVIEAGGQEWLIVPSYTTLGDGKEIKFLPVVADKNTGNILLALSPLPEGSSGLDNNYMVHGAKTLEELPAIVRKKLADLTGEMADTFHVSMNEDLHSHIAGTRFLPTTEEFSRGLDTMLQESVAPYPNCSPPYLESTLIKNGETAWEAAVQRVPCPESAFALRPVFTNMETGEAFSLKVADAQERDDDIRKRKINAVSEVICEQISPEHEELSLGEFCERVPTNVRSFASLQFEDIGRPLNTYFSQELRHSITMPNSREAQSALADDEKINATMGKWTEQFPPRQQSHAEEESAKKDSPPDGPAL